MNPLELAYYDKITTYAERLEQHVLALVAASLEASPGQCVPAPLARACDLALETIQRERRGQLDAERLSVPQADDDEEGEGPGPEGEGNG